VTVAFAGLVLAAIGAPHLLRLESAPPGLAAFIWLAALALRALTAVFCAIFVVSTCRRRNCSRWSRIGAGMQWSP
jgi:hypothetical protein